MIGYYSDRIGYDSDRMSWDTIGLRARNNINQFGGNGIPTGKKIGRKEIEKQ